MSTVEWRSWDEQVTRKEVESVGEKLGVKFPLDYIEVAMEYNGAHVSPELFQVEGKEKVFGTLLTYDNEDDEHILEVFKDYRDTLPEKIVPFAFDPSGNLICFDYKNHEDNPIVVFWEHENAGEKEMLMREEGLTEEEVEDRARENVYFIAETFTDFLNKLHD
ncbi:SMI1/KNR4 family protein [Virgibacillus dakarensis]|uniref:SMI1/KNR4 family protein n=1 Tax=Virgibacillus dakarensis TaxID=1917889 RepID=UPI000B44D542|nr:SMI1/KNR4 family protein [Virgibacillus dakarensis]MBT2216286.1 SMI1/KNR4 family protein [Virgibacillus dakarensis]